MFSGFPNSDDVGFIEASATGNSFHIPSEAKSHYFIPNIGIIVNIYLPSIAPLGKIIMLHSPLGVTGGGRTSTVSNANIYSGNTLLFNLKNGSVTFVYTGSYLNAFSAGVTTGRDSKSGWVVVGNAMSINHQLGNGSSVVMGSGAYSSAANAVVLGVDAYATSNSAIAIGNSRTAGGSSSISIGNSGSSAGINSISIGYNAFANKNSDISIGEYAGSKGLGTKFSIRPCYSTGISASYDNQSGMYMPHILTTNATPVNMTTSNSANTTDNLIGAENNSAHACIGTVIAREGATGNSAMWEVKFLMKRGANASTTALVGTPTVTKLFNDTGATAWTLAVNADTTNGGVYFVATGEESKTIKWSSNIQYSMVTG